MARWNKSRPICYACGEFIVNKQGNAVYCELCGDAFSYELRNYTSELYRLKRKYGRTSTSAGEVRKET